MNTTNSKVTTVTTVCLSKRSELIQYLCTELVGRGGFHFLMTSGDAIFVFTFILIWDPSQTVKCFSKIGLFWNIQFWIKRSGFLFKSLMRSEKEPLLYLRNLQWELKIQWNRCISNKKKKQTAYLMQIYLAEKCSNWLCPWVPLLPLSFSPFLTMLSSLHTTAKINQ